MNKDSIVKLYDLQPHPEGGFYKRTYQSTLQIDQTNLGSSFHGPRACSTAIYFLLDSGSKSHLHRIASDEIWHFYLGGPMTVLQIAPGGEVIHTVLGQDLAIGQTVQHCVPAGHWFGAFPNPGTEFAFVGCTVSPGFDFAEFEMANRVELMQKFPSARDWIIKLTAE